MQGGTEQAGISDVRTQVKSGAIQWDIVELYGGQCQQAAAEGLVEPLDYSVINADGVPKDLADPHWIGFTAYSTVLALRRLAGCPTLAPAALAAWNTPSIVANASA